MAARHLRDKILEETNSNLQVSATEIVKDTQKISTVTNSDNDKHGSAQIQDILADILSNMGSV
jgi:vacuolar-type H+-ATPase subunit H